MHPGTLPLAVFLPERGSRAIQAGRGNPRARARTPSRRSRSGTGVVVIASLFEKRASGLYHNTAAIIDADGSLLGNYRKMHIPDDPLYYEKFYFTPGRHRVPGVEDHVRQDRRPDLLGPVVPGGGPADRARRGRKSSSIPPRSAGTPEKGGCGARQHDAWETVQRGPRDRQRVLRRGVQPGRARGAGRRGRDRVLGPELRRRHGRRGAREGAASQEEILVVAGRPRAGRPTRTHWPFLRDRRIDAYGEITKRFRD